MVQRIDSLRCLREMDEYVVDKRLGGFEGMWILSKIDEPIDWMKYLISYEFIDLSSDSTFGTFFHDSRHENRT
jgi:hypothetical protein